MTILRMGKGMRVGICGTLLMLSACDQFKNADEHRERAARLLSEGAFSEAMIELKNAEAAAPDDARVKLLVAQASLKLGSIDAATKALEDAAKAGADATALSRLRAQLLLDKADYPGLLALAADQGTQLSTPDRELLSARALASLDRCTEAIPLARRLLQNDPALGSARLALAECYARHGNPARALKELELPANAQDANVLLARGRVESLLDKREAAQASWTEAVKNTRGELSVSQQAILLSGIADLQFEKGDTQGLHETFQKFLRIAPQARITRLLEARLQLFEGKLDVAVNELRKLASEAPELPAVHMLLVSAYVEQRNWEQARREAALLDSQADKTSQRLNEQIGATAAAPADSEEFWMRSAAVQMALGQVRPARSALDQVVARNPGSLAARIALARLDLKAGNSAAALKTSSDLVAQRPDDIAVKALQADALVAAGKFAEASQLLDEIQARSKGGAIAIAAYDIRRRAGAANENAPLERWLAANPRDLAVRLRYAEALRAQGDERAATNQYESLVASAPKNIPALNNLAWLYYLGGDKRALATAKQAWELSPHTPAVQDTYGWLLVESGSVEEGVDVLKAADSKSGLTRPEIRLHYVAALARHGQRELAQRLMRELMAESPDFSSDRQAALLLTSLSSLSTT